MKQRERRWAVERGALSARLVEMESSFAEQVKELRRDAMGGAALQKTADQLTEQLAAAEAEVRASPHPHPHPKPHPNPNPNPNPNPTPGANQGGGRAPRACGAAGHLRGAPIPPLSLTLTLALKRKRSPSPSPNPNPEQEHLQP